MMAEIPWLLVILVLLSVLYLVPRGRKKHYHKTVDLLKDTFKEDTVLRNISFHFSWKNRFKSYLPIAFKGDIIIGDKFLAIIPEFDLLNKNSDPFILTDETKGKNAIPRPVKVFRPVKVDFKETGSIKSIEIMYSDTKRRYMTYTLNLYKLTLEEIHQLKKIREWLH